MKAYRWTKSTLTQACKRLSKSLKLGRTVYIKLSLVVIVMLMTSGTLLYVIAISSSVHNQYGVMVTMNNLDTHTASTKAEDNTTNTTNYDTVTGSGGAVPGRTDNSHSDEYVPPPLRPFNVGDVTMDVRRGCYEGFDGYEVSESVFVDDITLVLTSEHGGEVKMVLDIEGLKGASPQHHSVTIPEGNTYYKVKQSTTEPGPVFLVETPPSWEGHDSYRMRVRITSPNAIASSWFVSPARPSGAPCVPS